MRRAMLVQSPDDLGVETATGHQQKEPSLGGAGIQSPHGTAADDPAERFGGTIDLQERAKRFSVPLGDRARGTPGVVRFANSAAVPSPPAATRARSTPCACQWLAREPERQLID
jgi:hypothetical protein